jgi:hypothetical protein
MSAADESLWSRAVAAARARGLLPGFKSPLTPRELAYEAARRGEDRLMQLVNGWYYPASYGRVRGMLSDDEARRLVAALEAESTAAAKAAAETPAAPAAVETPPAHRKKACQLCGFPLSRR